MTKWEIDKCDECLLSYLFGRICEYNVVGKVEFVLG